MLPTASLLESSSLEIDLAVMRAWKSKKGGPRSKKRSEIAITNVCYRKVQQKHVAEATFAGTVTVAVLFKLHSQSTM